MAKRLLRKTLSAPGLLRVVRGCFDEVEDSGSGRRSQPAMQDDGPRQRELLGNWRMY